MKVLATFHPSSSVLASCKWQLLDDARSEFLVVAKINQLDIYSLQPEGLRHEHALEIWGRVRAVRVVPVKKSTAMHLLVLTDHPDPELIFVTYTTHSSRKSELRITKKLSLAERTGRIAEFFIDLLVDPTGQLAIVSTYAGKLKVIQLKNGEYHTDFDVSTTELNLLSLATILPSPDDLTVALLHVDYQQRLQLLTRDLSIKEVQLSPLPSVALPSVPLTAKYFSVDEEVPKLIHVPILSEEDEEGFAGGILVIGGSKIFLYDLAPVEKQRKQKEKQRRAQKKKASVDSDEVMKEVGKSEKKKKARASVEWPWAEISAWCQVDDVGRRFLLGDRFGRLVMLCVDVSSNSSLTLIALGETSPATTLTYLSNQIVYLGSHYGDSQLLQISPSGLSDTDAATLPVPENINTVTHIPRSSSGNDRKNSGFIVNGRGSYLTEVDRFQNIAPIYDAALVDPDNSGQYEIVTCSGGQNTGSIRLVRNGADFQEAAVIGGIPDVTNIWPVRSRYHDPIHSHIVVSTPQETHVFRIDNKHTVSHVSEGSGFVAGRTLVVQNLLKRVPREAGQGSTYMDSSLVLQVTSEKLVLLNFDEGLGEFTCVEDGMCSTAQLAPDQSGWTKREIVAASANASQIVLGLSYGRLAVVSFADNKFKLVSHRDFPSPSGGIAEISAVSCTPADQSKNFSQIAAVAFWQTHHVELVSLVGGSLSTICASVSLPSLPRSLLMHRFAGESPEASPHLLVGRADGIVATFVLKDKMLLEQKQIPVGNLPVTFHLCEANGRTAIFACGSRTSVLFWEKDRLRHSPLILKDVAAAASLNTHDYRSSLVLATSEGLVVGDIQNLEKLHIRSIHTGLDNPRRISHSPVHKVLAVGCVRHTPVRVGEPENMQGSVQLYNDTTLNKLGQVVLDHDEEPSAVRALSVRVGEETKHCFAVGTVKIDSLENEPSAGRLLLIEPDYSRGDAFVAVSASEKVKGCVYAVAAVDGLVVAAVNSAVVIYSVDADDHTRALSFVKKVEWNHNYVVTNLVSRGNMLLVGDAISSVSLLQYEKGALQTIARDYSPLWPTSVEMLDEQNVIGADTDYNLFMFTLQDGAARKVLERNGYYYFGDTVNKFIPGALSSFEASDIPVEPKQLFFTLSGNIGAVIDMSDELSLHMSSLQRNLSAYFGAQPGGVSHAKYRAPKNVRGRSDADNASYGFLDGDLLERFLLFGNDEEAIKKVLEGSTEAERLSISAERIIKVLERLQSMH